MEAPFGQANAVLMITGIDVPEPPFPCKDIIGYAGVIDTPETPGINMEVTETPAVISFNFDDLKGNLKQSMTKYQNIIVTEESLAGCKSTQRELAGLRRRIDDHRKRVKDKHMEPIRHFEAQCKELTELITAVENPIKEGIKTFDDLKHNAKFEEAQAIINSVASEIGLKDKYKNQLTIQDRYGNLTITKADVELDVRARADALLLKQKTDEEMTGIINDAIERENARLKTKLTFDGFTRLINNGASTSDILAEIKASADMIYAAENKPPEPVEPPVEKPVETPVEKPVEKPEEAPEICFMVCRISGSLDDLKAVKNFALERGLTFKALEQGVI